jgi:hypothetical protein
MLRFLHVAFLLVFLLLTACHRSGSLPGKHLTTSSPAASPRVCNVGLEDGTPAPMHAIRCAEDFILQNGYTASPPTADSTLIALESIERARSLTQLLEQRHNTLHRHAIGVCETEAEAAAYIVVFRFTDHISEIGRAVTMSRAFTELRVQHRDFLLSNLFEQRHGCRTVSPAA